MKIRKKKLSPGTALFILPTVLLFVLLLLYPVLSSVFYSFTNKHLIKTRLNMVAFENYASVLRDKEYWNALLTSSKWTLICLAGQFLIGFTAALSLERIKHGRTLFRTLLIVPWAFPTIIIALVWKYLLNGVSGFIPNLLLKLNWVSESPQFLSNKDLVFPTLVFINVWFGFPLIMVNVLSALQTVPKELYEAARIDGAKSGQQFFYITMPQINPVITLLLILRTVWIFNNFDLIYLITGGGPAGLTKTVSIYAYEVGWGLKSLGRSSAVSILSLIFLTIVIVILLQLQKKTNKNE
jgi:multiple sugar transport system permease protein